MVSPLICSPLVAKRAFLFSLVVAICAACAADVGAEQPIDFRRDIKPIFSNHCFTCHGPDAGQRKADLRLDVRDVAIESAVEPGDAAASELIARVTSTDPKEHMPPPKSNKPRLSKKQIELLRRWIDEGAKYDVHWSFVAPQRPDLPAIKQQGWPVRDIDYFVAAGQESHGFTASAPADRRTLVRRLYFDLTGLPPTPAEVDAFVSDKSPSAYEKLVDRLLASKHYGERMAIYWLDMVRYADTNGIHGDNHRDHAPYRDYVIGAFNDNKPFDEFTIEQLAGDLLPEATVWQKVASGYNRLNMTTREGGAQPKEYMAKYAADRVRNASSVWMGMTLGCAECHDHKFDPLTSKDFYSFASFFADVQETAVGTQGHATKVPGIDQAARIAELEQQIAEAEKQLASETTKLAAGQPQWEKEILAKLESGKLGWTPLKPADVKSSGGATLKVQDDLSVLSTEQNPAKDDYTVTLPTDATHITAIRLEALPHASLAAQGLSRGNGNFVLTHFEVQAAKGDAAPQTIKVTRAEADYSQKDFPPTHALDGQPNTGWAVEGHQKKGESRRAMFVLEKPIEGGAGTRLVVTMRHQSQHNQHNIGCFRLSITSNDAPSIENSTGVPEALAKFLATPVDQRNEQQKAEIAKHYQDQAPELKPLRDRIAAVKKQRQDAANTGNNVLITVAGNPRTMRVLPRGNWLDDSGPVVEPATPGFLFDLGVKDRRANRLDLAKWIVARDNPLTARVFVNRLWKIVFGQGIVTSLDDFGAQGAFPTHPQLLDWLGVELVDSGWDVKHMMKLLVMSSTYRQSSRETPQMRERDPANKWLARQNRFRLEAEMVRDNALAVSGLLIKKLGGVSVKPYQPAGYWAHLNFPTRRYKHDSGESQYRRGLYTYWCRTFLHPSLLAFDAPSREECTVQRPRSNTPLQALVLLNDPTYVEAARVFAGRLVRDGGESVDERLHYAFREVLGRKPNSAEMSILSALYEKHRKQYEADKAAASQISTVGEAKATDGLDPVELAAWTSVSRTILNLHETITRY